MTKQLFLGIMGVLVIAASDSYAAPYLSTQPIQQSAVACVGTVADADGVPIIGAAVQVIGTKQAANTDVDGKFAIPGVRKGARVSISFIGYKTVEQTWDGLPLSVTMIEVANELNEMVVVGYGVQKKVNLTGSVSVVNGDELQYRPVTDAVQALQGLVPGLYVSNSDAGRPGAEGTMQLRGQGNLSGSSSPYVLVDGVEMSLSDINPNDIESISVLKDGAACAVYGARAAYGVILVTTRRGEEGKSRISYQGSVGWNKPTTLPKMVNSVDFANYWNAGCINGNSTRLYSDEKIALLQQYIDDASSVDPWFELSATANMNPAFENSESGVGNTNYFDLHYKDWAFKQNHNLSVSGGSKSTRYYVSGGFFSEDGILRYADMSYKRLNFNSSITSQLTKWLRVKASTKFMHSDNETPFGDGGLSEGFYHSLARFRPTVHYIDPNGNFTELSMIPYLQSGTFTETKRNRLNLTGGFEIEPMQNWKIIGDYTFKYMTRNYEALNVAPLIYAADGVSTSQGVRDELGISPDGKYTRSNAETCYQTINLYTNYTFDIAEKNEFSVMVGYQEENNTYQYMYDQVTGLYSTTNPSLAMASGDRTVVDTRNSWATRGYYGRINYSYDNRYLLELNGRYDGSSRFASNNRWGFFPSASVGWNLHREAFMVKSAPYLSNLKLRLSYGLLGNQAGAALYTFASTMSMASSLGNYIFADGRHIYTLAPGVVDPNTTWEKVESKNAAIDYGFFNNALTGTVEIFQRDTKDMLGPGVNLPDLFGADAPETNNANMRNRGWELSINYRGRIDQVSFSIGGSVSDATSVVTKYANENGTDPASSWYVGRKVGEIWGYRSSGLIQTEAEAAEYNKLDLSYISSLDWLPGDVKYIDINGDGKIDRGNNRVGDMGDMVVIGNTTPRYQYTINASANWRNFGLSLMFQGVGKRDWSPGSSAYFWGSGPYAQVTVFEEHMDYWTPDNPNAYYPNPYINTAGGVGQYRNKNIQTSDRYLQSAAYCRLKNVTFSYDLPTSVLRQIGMSKVQVFFSGENLLTFTNLMGMFDPESIFTSNGYTSEGGKNYPMNKVVSFGLVVNL